jgi:hypothetical protein
MMETHAIKIRAIIELPTNWYCTPMYAWFMTQTIRRVISKP